MIDTKLIKAAKEKSQIVEKIDESWRKHVSQLKEVTFVIPFTGNYSVLVEDNAVLVEGYCGELIINKVYSNRKTYFLKKPIQHQPFRIYGVYDNHGQFQCFVTRPEIGFHYMGMGNHGRNICTGEIHYQKPNSLDSLKEIAAQIISSFQAINLDSLGETLLPDDYEELRNIFMDKECDKLEKLLELGLITEFFKGGENHAGKHSL